MAYFLPKTKVFLPKEIISIILSYIREKHPVVDKCLDDIIEDYKHFNRYNYRNYSFQEEYFKQIKSERLFEIETNGCDIYKISKDGIWSKYFKAHYWGSGCHLIKIEHNHIEIEEEEQVETICKCGGFLACNLETT